MIKLTCLDFLDYYFDLLSYVHNRQNRESIFEQTLPPPPETSQEEYDAARHKYLGRERANLRKRRTRLRHGDFQILTQVGQGGYGQVYLAAKKDTREVCALKVMSKKLLFKLDEIRHILTERDILTAAKSEWLVKLLYAFQDDKSIYLAMVSNAMKSAGLVLTSSHRNTFQGVTSVPFSTTLASCTTAIRVSTSRRCSAVSTPCISWVISIAT